MEGKEELEGKQSRKEEGLVGKSTGEKKLEVQVIKGKDWGKKNLR